jgi:hypothetical protein
MNQDELGVAGDLIWQQGTRKVRAVLQGGCSAGPALEEHQAHQSSSGKCCILSLLEQPVAGYFCFSRC